MSYNRDRAFDYAIKYWNRVCDDGYVAVGEPARPAYIAYPAGSLIEPLQIDGEDDCTHFVSRCIGFVGGGLSIPSTEGMIKGISSAPRLVRYLRSSGLVRTIVEKVPKTVAANYIDQMDTGDVIAYFRVKDEDYGRTADYGHTALHIGIGRVSCHTISRIGTDFKEVGYGSDLITLLHIGP